MHPRHPGDQTIGHAGGQGTGDKLILPVEPPSADDIVPLIEFGEHPGDVYRVVLQVGVHQDDDLACGMVNPGGDRGGLAEIAAQNDGAHVFWIGQSQGF